MSPVNCAPTAQGIHSPPGCPLHLPLYRCQRSLCQSQPTAELPIAAAFAAGLPIAPATIPLPALAVPIATYCRAAHRACILRRAAHRACIRRRAAYCACRTRFVLSSRLLQSCPSRLHSPPGCLLRGTWYQTIRYSCDSHENPNVLWGWVDADWAGDTNTRRSHTGYILMMNGGPISWKSRRQDNVSLSTSKAEFVAASQAEHEAIYLRETLTDFVFSQMVADALTKSLLSPAFVGHRQIMTGHASFAAKLLRCAGGYAHCVTG